MAFIVQYDDLNPILDRFLHHVRKHRGAEASLKQFRLEDHMDGILSVAVTRLVDMLYGENLQSTLSPRKARRRLRRMSRARRADLLLLTLLYDHPASASQTDRWIRIRRLLRFGTINWAALVPTVGMVMTLATAAFGFALWRGIGDWLLWCAFAVSALSGAYLLGSSIRQFFKNRKLSRLLSRELPSIDRSRCQLRDMLNQLAPEDLRDFPLPLPSEQDARYQIFKRLLGVLSELGFTGMIVLLDRIDEPTVVKGNPDMMKPLVWPLLDNKFLQQERVGVKLLLPADLSHLLRREDSEFFQKARLDKQHLVEALVWSGPTLYELCNRRIAACMQPDAPPVTLKDFFREEVTEADIFDALEQMHQPRDAFKMMYQVIQDHCLQTSENEADPRIPRLTLEHVRRQQSQRVQDFGRGLSPA